jgi:RNA polymerase sigma-70 factor, ECF subfamily
VPALADVKQLVEVIAMSDPSAHLKLVRAGPPEHVSDVDLAAAVRRGDATVAAVFYGRVSPRIWAVLRRLLRGNEQDHEDLAQQTLIALVNGLDRYRGQAPLETWAGAVAGHIALDWLRHHRRERALFECLTESSLERPSADRPDRTALTNEVVEQLKAVVGGVTEDRLNAWVLHDVHGFSLAEIAQMTQASLSAVQSRLVRGRGDVHARLAHQPALVQALRGTL